MKRSDFFIRLTTGVIFLAVACYIGVNLYDAFVNTYVTTPAIRYSVEETLPAHGFIIRTELVLDEDGAGILPIVGEGEKVAVMQDIAVRYMSLDDLEIASEIRALRIKIAQMESARGIDDSASFDAVVELSAAVCAGDLRNFDEIVFNIEASVFSVEADISELYRRLEELEVRSVGEIISAPVSGTFSNVVDGFEHISPGMVYNMTPNDLNAHFRTPYGARGMGKIITEFKWYYAAIMDVDDASRLSDAQRDGQLMTVQFFGAYNADVEMRIESISRREDGYCVVLFSSDRGIHDIAPMRSLRADIVYSVTTGIRVPREAIHLDDDNSTFIYLQTSGYAERVDVEILDPPGEIGNSYLVRDGEESGSKLRVDSIIIVRANNLYHGKVVT